MMPAGVQAGISQMGGSFDRGRIMGGPHSHAPDKQAIATAGGRLPVCCKGSPALGGGFLTVTTNAPALLNFTPRRLGVELGGLQGWARRASAFGLNYTWSRSSSESLQFKLGPPESVPAPAAGRAGAYLGGSRVVFTALAGPVPLLLAAVATHL